jgi:hypothetical protein
VKGPFRNWGRWGSITGADSFFYTGVTIDPKEQMIVIFTAQLHPTGDLTLDRQVNELAYQAIND